MVPSKGLEPPHRCRYMDLNHARLPIPPRWQSELQCSGGPRAAVSGRLTLLFLQPCHGLSNHRREPLAEIRSSPIEIYGNPRLSSLNRRDLMGEGQEKHSASSPSSADGSCCFPHAPFAASSSGFCCCGPVLFSRPPAATEPTRASRSSKSLRSALSIPDSPFRPPPRISETPPHPLPVPYLLHRYGST